MQYKFSLTLLLLLLASFSYTQDWEKTFLHETGLAKGFDVIQTADNGYLMVGEVDLPTGAIRHYIWLVKTDNNGNQLWSKIYSGGDIADQNGRALIEGDNGDVFIVGSNFNKASVLKTNINGDSLWTREFGGQGVNAFHDIAQDIDGNLLLVGEYEEEFNSGLHEVWVMSMNTSGDSLWSEKYFTPSFSDASATDISPLSNNKFLVVGSTEGQGFSMKIDGLQGSQEWANTYQLSVGDNLYAGTTRGGESSFMIGGSITGFAGFSPVLFATNSEGVFDNTINFLPTPFGAITSIESTSDAGLILTGSSYSFWDQIQPNMAGFISKLDANLEIEWSLAYADSLDKQGASIHQDSNGDYIVAGSRRGGMWLKKIAGNPTSTNSNNQSYSAIKVYPNPAHSSLSIVLPAQNNINNISYTLHDFTGRQVFTTTLSDQITSIDVGLLPRGVYFYTLQHSFDQSISGKVILQ